jgi:hypothetical protein
MALIRSRQITQITSEADIDALIASGIIGGDRLVANTIENSQLDKDIVAFKRACRAATDGNITLANLQTVDGVSLAAGDRVLVKDQGTPSQDGIYIVVDGGSWTRADDAAVGADLAQCYVPIAEGTTNGTDKLFRETSAIGSGIVGTNDLTFIEFSTGASALAGNGLTENGGALDVNPGNGIALDTDQVVVDLTAASGLEFSSGDLQVKAGDGVQIGGGVGAADAVNIDVSAFAGTGLVDDGSENLQIDTNSTVDFSSSTPVWTFGNETTAEGLFVTGTPVDATHVVNKNYVDNLASGLQWRSPADTKDFVGNVFTVGLIGNTDITGLNTHAGGTPAAGDAFVCTAAGTPSAGGSDAMAIGSVAEWDGAAWKEVASGDGTNVPAGAMALSTTVALQSPYTDGTDDGRIYSFTGAGGLTGSNTALTDISAPTGAGVSVVVSKESAGESDGVDEGDIQEWSGTAWVQVVAGSGGFVAADASVIVHDEAVTLLAPLTDNTDESKYINFDGTANDASGMTGEYGLFASSDGDARLIKGDASVNNNSGWVYDTATSTWVQFTGGASLSPGNGIDITGNTVSVVPADLIRGGSAEVDGDKLDITWTGQAKYSPATTPTEVDNTDELTAHLYGIDVVLAQNDAAISKNSVTLSSTLSGTNEDTGIQFTGLEEALDDEPLVYVNGVLYDCEFGGSGAGPFFVRDAAAGGGSIINAVGSVQAGHYLHVNTTALGFDLIDTPTADVIELVIRK